MSDLQEVMDNYDKEGHGLARLDREEKLIKAADDLLEEFNVRGGDVTLDSMGKFAVVVQDVKTERKRMGLL